MMMYLMSRIRGPGVCGGRLFPALYPSPQPHQPGGDQRQTGVPERREGRAQATFKEDCTHCLLSSHIANPNVSLWHV